MSTAWMLVLTALLALSFVMVDAGEAAAQDDKVYTLSLQTVAPARTPWARQLERIKKKWEAESGGRLKVKIFLGRGNENALVRKCRSGELQAVGVSSAALADEVPEIGVFELPYLFDNAAQADKVIDNHLTEPVEKLLAKNGFQLLLFSENGFRNFATRGKVIKTPEDLATLKMRTQESWIHENTYKALGGNPVRVSVAEVLTSLSTKQVDGFDNTPLFAFATSWFTQIDTWTVSDHIYQPGIVVLNKQWFDSLPPDLQSLVLGIRKEETPKGRSAVRGLTPKLIEKLEEKGVTVYKMTPAEKAAFAKKTSKVHQEFRAKIGAEGVKLLDLIEKNK